MKWKICWWSLTTMRKWAPKKTEFTIHIWMKRQVRPYNPSEKNSYFILQVTLLWKSIDTDTSKSSMRDLWSLWTGGCCKNLSWHWMSFVKFTPTLSSNLSWNPTTTCLQRLKQIMTSTQRRRSDQSTLQYFTTSSVLVEPIRQLLNSC